MKLILIAILLIANSASAGEVKPTKGKSGALFEPIVGKDGKPMEVTLKGMIVRTFDKLKVDDHELVKDLSPYGFQVEITYNLWVGHVSKAKLKEIKESKSRYIEMDCVAVAKEKSALGDFFIYHAKCGKQSSSWLPF